MNFHQNFHQKSFVPAALVPAAFALAALVLPGCALFTEKEPPAPPEAPISDETLSFDAKTLVSTDFANFVPAKPPKQAEAELNALYEETGKIILEKNLIESRIALALAENEKAHVSWQFDKMQLDADRADRAAKLTEELAGIEEERVELERRFALETARGNAAIREKQQRLTALELESRELQNEIADESLRAAAKVAAADSRDRLAKVAPAAVKSKYLKDPFVDGTLYISDRRIALNGAIDEELAKSVCEQIYFFNNQNAEYPIFLVIDNSPGGSVSAGYQIQQAMKSSKAPVYVVVKSFAASMAAVITTTSERSFCFENTQILHHQISTGVQGNLTVLREGVAEGEKWYRRFMSPVADKMGITLEEFTRQMYAHNSDGDWVEIGPRAVELKWVDNIVTRVEESGVIALSEKKNPQNGAPAEQTDAQGRRYVELPPLSNPFDFWAIYDKNNYYRAR